MKVLVVVGTRPEAIKMAPVIRELRARPGRFSTLVCATAQHRSLLDSAIQLFGIGVDFDLDIMRHDQSLCQAAAGMLRGLDTVLAEACPDAVLVHGDTATSVSAALAAFYHQIPAGHVEAGLRTADRQRPFPEEMNRRLADRLCAWHYAPTERARQNLLEARFPEEHILVTGNTVIDALLDIAARPYTFTDPLLDSLGRERRLLLVTAHRRESFGAPLRELCAALRAIARDHPDVEIVYPVHPNPNVRETVEAALKGIPRIHCIAPLPYLPFVHLMKRATLILTDSGGIQEEAPALGKPVLVLRDETERPEAIEAGTARLVGARRDRIVAETRGLLEDPAARARIARTPNPFGDGRASARIVDHLESRLGAAAPAVAGGLPG
ncbi:MAG: UDP-N-acetylglucosamine 2-epimerase (non-hydrolyzing) [Candidatus Hydrogenedentes bacterium]|nr:UDP-N-acetylglucosamine 2-epimerase (non-hydrolyzing) [Candidatus Hydrogenedentota bacterium]